MELSTGSMPMTSSPTFNCSMAILPFGVWMAVPAGKQVAGFGSVYALAIQLNASLTDWLYKIKKRMGKRRRTRARGFQKRDIFETFIPR